MGKLQGSVRLCSSVLGLQMCTTAPCFHVGFHVGMESTLLIGPLSDRVKTVKTLNPEIAGHQEMVNSRGITWYGGNIKKKKKTL